jgi:cytochrome o ubiquinol oxidase subunit 2
MLPSTAKRMLMLLISGGRAGPRETFPIRFNELEHRSGVGRRGTEVECLESMKESNTTASKYGHAQMATRQQSSARPMRDPAPPTKRASGSRLGWVAAMPLISLLSGCNAALLDPKGQVATDEKHLIITATLLMLIVVIPVIFLTLYFAWRYRASNTSATYQPNWSYSHRIEAVVWAVPLAIVLVLGTITWKSTHALDPYRPLVSKAKPITIDVVALDWKWLFIYPDQHIATINEVAFPTGVPVNFRITSDTVMNVFFIPQLGSQIYAMAGMQTQVNLAADQDGVYDGLSTNFSGAGFPDMEFKAHATSQADFDAWVAKVRSAKGGLDFASYAQLAKASTKAPIAYFSSVEPLLFAAVLDKYMDKSSGLKLADKICLPKVVAKASE